MANNSIFWSSHDWKVKLKIDFVNKYWKWEIIRMYFLLNLLLSSKYYSIAFLEFFLFFSVYLFYLRFQASKMVCIKWNVSVISVINDIKRCSLVTDRKNAKQSDILKQIFEHCLWYKIVSTLQKWVARFTIFNTLCDLYLRFPLQPHNQQACKSLVLFL